MFKCNLFTQDSPQHIHTIEDLYMVLLVLTTLIVLDIAVAYISVLTTLQMMGLVLVIMVTCLCLVLEVRHGLT